MIITFEKDGLIIASAYGVIQGNNMLHYQVAKMLVENSSVVRETQDVNAETRTIVLQNEAEEKYLDLKNEAGTQI